MPLGGTMRNYVKQSLNVIFRKQVGYILHNYCDKTVFVAGPPRTTITITTTLVADWRWKCLWRNTATLPLPGQLFVLPPSFLSLTLRKLQIYRGTKITGN